MVIIIIPSLTVNIEAEANPEDSVGCIISNHAPPVTKFVKANKNMKNISKDDELWALYHGFNPERALLENPS